MGRRVRGLLAAIALFDAHQALAEPTTASQRVLEKAQLPAHLERISIRETVERDGRSEHVTEAQVLLRDAAGVAQFGQIGSPYIDGFGEVAFDRITIEKPDGRRVTVSNGKVEDINPFGMSGVPVPADLRLRRLTIPGLEPGDRLTYRTTLRQKALIPGVTSGEFKFIVGPLASEQVYELDAPGDLQLSLWRRPDLGAEWEDVPARGGRRVRRLTLRRPIALPKEDGPSDVLVEPDVLFTTFRSWEELGKWWWGISRGKFQPDAAIRTEAERLVKGMTNLPQRVQALHAFVSGQVRYMSVGFGVGRYEPLPASEVLVSRYGDCKGKHALMAALGSAAGIEVLPVLVHSARSDLNDEVPAAEQFDHLISVVRQGDDPARWLWVDATSDLAPAGYLPRSLRGKRALVMGPDIVRVVNTPERPPFKTTTTIEATGLIDAGGPIRARVRWTVRDDSEPLLRATIRMAPRDKWTDVGKRFAKEWSKGEVSDVKAGDPSDLGQPFWIEYAVEHRMTPQTLEKPWNFWVPLPEIRLPAPDKDAKPGDAMVELESSDETVVRARYEIPEGMQVRVPLSVNLDRPFATYRSTYALNGRILSVERVLQVKQRKVTAEQLAAYEAFRNGVQADRGQSFPVESFRAGRAPTLETADDLNAAGYAALDRGDAKEAEELFRKATEKEAKHKWAWNNLGRALRKQGRHEEALKAFTRQIEINPYDPYAYDNRGALLAFDLRRVEEGEKDFLKQIEVAPLEPDAYRDLAWLRKGQQKFAEAADLLERAAATKPSDFMTLLDLAWARARAGKGDVAAAVERAVAADTRPRGAISAARAVAVSGDAAGAGRIAREALSKLMAELQKSDTVLDNEDFNYENDALYLGEAWRLIGSAALAAGDLAAADRYLTAAWEIAFTEDSAVALARLREKQGRRKEAAALKQQAGIIGDRKGATARPQGEPPSKEAPPPTVIVMEGDNTIARRHLQQLAGSAPVDPIDIRLRLIVDANGRVTDLRPRDPKDAGRLKLVRDRIVGASVVAANPDKETFKVIRGGGVMCFRGGACYLGIDLLADRVPSVIEH